MQLKQKKIKGYGIDSMNLKIEKLKKKKHIKNMRWSFDSPNFLPIIAPYTITIEYEPFINWKRIVFIVVVVITIIYINIWWNLLTLNLMK